MNSICIFMIAVVAGVYGGSWDGILTFCSNGGLCAHKHDGTYRFKRSPGYFYACVRSRNLGCQHCATRDLRYNEKCKECLSKFEDKKDQCSTTGPVGGGDMCAPNGFCKHRNDGTYQDPDNNKRFFSCVHGTATACQTCPDGLVYAQACGECLRKYKHDPSECSPPNPVNGIPVKKCSPAFCLHRANGDYEEPTYKGKYYTCSEGTCFIRHCPTGTAFSEKCGGRCAYPSECQYR